MDEVPARLLRNEENVMKFQDTNLPLSEQVKRYEKEIISKKTKRNMEPVETRRIR